MKSYHLKGQKSSKINGLGDEGMKGALSNKDKETKGDEEEKNE